MAYIELSKQAYFDNLQLLSHRLGSKEKLAVVLKDNAYGHGLIEMARLANEFGISKAIVRNVQEAREIKGVFPFIMILAPDMKEELDDFSLVINSLESLSQASKNAKIHLKVDSGMHRNGISISQLEDAFIMIKKQGLILEGVMTHFRSADECNTELFWQMKVWDKIKASSLEWVQKYGFKRPLFHSANSATVLRLSAYHDDFARCGIATYGYDEFSHKESLKPPLRLWAEKISTRALKKGQAVGYGGAGVCYHDMQVSTYDVGYADGYFRYKGDGDLMTEKGFKILGRVSMDNLSVESIDEKVALFSDVRGLADYHDTIVYDVLVKLSPHLKRVVV
jgi:alanine racemase